MERKSLAARAVPAARASIPTALLLGLAPFTAFAVLLGLSLSMALWAAFALAFTLGLQAFLDSGRIRGFDAVNTLLFGLLAIFCAFIPPGITAAWVRLGVEGTLLAAMLVSLVRGRPLAAQYANESSGRTMPLSLVWAGALMTMAVADASVIFLSFSDAAAAAAGLVVLAGALTFTLRYR
ncbi:MAG: hypothetical protein JOZ72_12100 [Alphaproteobacteria bacterium]|nr:hypothetical protein [Alphaproteobacteria bacterium]